LSTLVKVDTANTDGKMLSDASRATPAYQSDALDLDLSPVNQMIDQIIGANAG